jgi:hypothetical protein
LWQLPPLEQQPLGHESRSQMQVPLWQRRPMAHCEENPHRQLPKPLQVSARVGSHVWHVPPSAPQLAAEVGLMQLLPLQHPVGQVVLSHPAHTWLLQAMLAPHIAQGAPPVPHSVLAVPALHWVPLQQPVAQPVASHTQTPPEQV